MHPVTAGCRAAAAMVSQEYKIVSTECWNDLNDLLPKPIWRCDNCTMISSVHLGQLEPGGHYLLL